MTRAMRWTQVALIPLTVFAGLASFAVSANALAGAQANAPSTAPPPPFPPGITGTTRTTYYEVHGRTAAQLAGALRRQGPKGDDGQLRTAFTESRFSWQYTTRPDGPACRAVGVRVIISAEVLMPKWVPPADTQPGVLAIWNESMKALAVHEAGHSDIRVRFATAIRDRTTAMRTRCDHFTAEADSVSNAIVAEMRAAQAKYDADTQNGLTQGTGFPPKRARPTVNPIRGAA